METENPQLILLDIMLGEDSGIDYLKEIRARGLQVPVVMITGHATIENAVEALRCGASDYIRKPVSFSLLLEISEKLIEEQAATAHDQHDEGAPVFITGNKELLEEVGRIKLMAESDIPVLITGESGTGKEILAELFHHYSLRKDQEMYKLNCAALPETLLENELFGHVKGAYTGAEKDYEGVFQRADRSTLFLDEIGDMTQSIQAKILRAIQNQEIRPVGSGKLIKVDVRFVAATNRDVENMIGQGKFREDLYYRLAAGRIHIPPLRERREDILPLSGHFMKVFQEKKRNREGQINPPGEFRLDKTVEKIFLEYNWPGNIRELKNTIQYSTAICTGGVIKVEHLPRILLTKACSTAAVQAGDEIGSFGPIDLMEKKMIREALEKTAFNKKEAAKILNISRTTLYQKIAKYGISSR